MTDPVHIKGRFLYRSRIFSDCREERKEEHQEIKINVLIFRFLQWLLSILQKNSRYFPTCTLLSTLIQKIFRHITNMYNVSNTFLLLLYNHLEHFKHEFLYGCGGKALKLRQDVPPKAHKLYKYTMFIVVEIQIVYIINYVIYCSRILFLCAQSEAP